MKLKHKKERKLNQKSKKQMNKLQKGITLIALVITIIVLLILAGVSIATLTGDNGILTKAQTAKEETEKASEEEQLKLAAMNAAMSTQEYDYATGEEDEKGQPITVPIPAGFAPTQIEGESTVGEGFVITDENGNEFVWIPVTDINQYERNTTYEDINVSKTAQDDTDYLPDDLKAKAKAEEEGKTEGDIEKETVLHAGGFYIGRYEAGAEGGKLEEKQENNTTTKTWTDEPTLVCKKGATVYTYINQINSKIKAKEFINNSDVKSGLITGKQWDVVMKFINEKLDGKGNSYNVKEYNESRHTGSQAKSGQNIADKVCNIYDLEGNYWEYIAELNTYGETLPYVSRGGFGSKRYKLSASYREHDYGVSGGGSFRFVLYVIKD